MADYDVQKSFAWMPTRVHGWTDQAHANVTTSYSAHNKHWGEYQVWFKPILRTELHGETVNLDVDIEEFLMHPDTLLRLIDKE